MFKNKKVLLIILGLAPLALIGFVLFKKSTVSDSLTTSSAEKSGAFASIKDALSKKVTLVCEFSNDSGVSTKSYIKNGAVRISSSGAAGDQSSDIIMKDKKMYMWDINTKQGFVYDIPDTQTTGEGVTNTEVNQSESYLNMIEQYKDSCKVATVEDSYFTPPTDITFQDMSNLLQEMQKYGNPQ
jgi:hypothetical protein